MTDINQARRKVFVVGVGMTKFEKPGAREVDYTDLAREAGTKALQDAGVSYDKIEQACVGYVYGESTSGEAAVYELGLTGIPIYNVNNNCSTGSTALFMAKQFIEGGLAECVLALGFEKMQKGSLNLGGSDRRNPLQRHIDTMNRVRGEAEGPMAVQMFGGAAREHIERYGSTKLQFAKVAEKNHRHSANNPYAQFQTVYTLDEVMASTTIFDPLTKLQCCPTSNGAGAAVLCSEAFVKANHLQDQAVEIAGMAMATDFASSFEKSCIKMIGSEMSAVAAQKALKQARLTVNDIQVIELHDCFSANELITYEALGLCGEGEGGKLIDSGALTYGGQWVVNPSGGLISKGHPLGATGLAQCAELCWQLRGKAEKRQVPNVRAALQHNLGLGGAAVVTVYRK